MKDTAIPYCNNAIYKWKKVRKLAKNESFYRHLFCTINNNNWRLSVYFNPECIPCVINQALRAAKLFTNGDKNLQLKILKEVCEEVKIINEVFTAPHFSAVIQEIVEKNVNNENPYKELKEKNIKLVEQFLPILEKKMEDDEDKLEEAIKIAIMGNTIDVGANPNFDIRGEIENYTSEDYSPVNIDQLKNSLRNAESILYIGDNYEEALFDKFLLKELINKDVTFAVRSKPILNDITLEDAKKLGIDKISKVIESGSRIGGTDLNYCTKEFIKKFNDADVVISKGQGNYETLLDEARPIYFLFKVKCEAIAERSGSPVGSSVIYYNNSIALN